MLAVDMSVKPTLVSSPENVQARFTLITTFLFAQKEPKSLPPGMFHRLNIYLNCVFGWGSPGPRWESLLRSPDSPAGFKWATSRRIGEGRVEGRMEGNVR